jgi:hypothetical protein
MVQEFDKPLPIVVQEFRQWLLDNAGGNLFYLGTTLVIGVIGYLFVSHASTVYRGPNRAIQTSTEEFKSREGTFLRNTFLF